MPESNLSMTAANIDKALVIATLDTSAISDADYLPFYSVSAGGRRKTTLGELKAAVTGDIRQPPPATTSDYGRGVVVQRDGSYGLGASTVPIFENFIVRVSEWVSDSGISPFAYSVSKASETAIGVNDAVELFNNDPYSFSKYGFNVDAKGSTLKFLAVEKPTELVVLRCRIWRNQ